jgi:hypothetical protein
MALTVDGEGAFAISTPTIANMVVESLSLTETGERVDLNDQEGLPIGSTVIPGRTEMSATLQVPSGGGSLPTVGGTVQISDVYFLTEVSIEETQADYRRVNVSGYKQLAGS